MERAEVEMQPEHGQPSALPEECDALSSGRAFVVPEFVAELWDSADPQLLIDPVTGQIVDANAAASRFYGWSRELLRSFTIDRINTLPLEEIRSRLCEAVQRPRSRFVFPHRFADGRIRPVEVITGPVRVGNRLLLWSTLHDVNELARQSDEFEFLARRYRTLIEQLPAVVYAEEVESPHRKVFVSPAAEQLLGWPTETLQVDRRTWYEQFVLPEDRARVLYEEERTDRTGETFRVEYRFRTGDGRVIWLRDEAVLVRDQLGEPRIWHGLLTDVTPQKRLELRLHRELAFHHLLLDVASRLVTGLDARAEDAIEGALAEIGTFLNVDHLGLFACEQEGLHRLALWHAPGVSAPVVCPDPAALGLSWLGSQLAAGRIVPVRSLDELGSEAASERTFFAQRGVRAFLAVPLISAGRLLGCLVAASRSERLWGEEELDLLALIGQFVVATLQRERAERVEAQHHAWLRATVLASPDALLVVDGEGIVRFASPATRTVLGRDPASINGVRLAELTSDPERVAEWLAAELAPDQPSRIEVEVPSNRQRVVELSAVDLRHEPHIGGIVLSVRDVSERRRAEQLLRERATHDPLTGLLNRFGFLEALERLTQGSRDGVRAVLCCDLERFSTLNDAIGWEAGDAALRAVAARLRTVETALAAARLEADRFALLLQERDEASVAGLARRLLEGLSGWYRLGSDEVYLRMRGGLAVAEPGYEPAHVLRRAEIAFQHGKRTGRQTLAIYDPQAYLASVERQLLERDLRRALENGELRVHYQPVVSLRDRSLVGLEALVRWHHPTRGAISPAVFVPIAEATGLISQLTQWVLLQTCRQLRVWHRQGLDRHLVVSVNLSPTDFLHIEVSQLVADILDVTGLAPDSLVLELTESAMLDPAVSLERLQRLRALGVAVVIDDFGAGYSSLAYLKQLPVSGLKLDRALIDDLVQNRATQAVVRSVLELARALHLHVTAEGIEDEEQFQLLAEFGCDYGQGFWITRPLPPDQIIPFLRRTSTF